MQTVSIQTAQNVDIRYPIASLSDRIFAYLIDSLIMGAYAVLCVFILSEISFYSSAVYILIIMLPLFLYHLLFEIFMNGQSPGKRQMRIQVIKMDGTTPTVGSYILRWLLRMIENGVLAAIVIVINGKGQRLGDLAAGTTVIKLSRPIETTSAHIFTSVEEGYSPVFPQAARLEDRDIELIQQALEVNRNTGNSHPATMASERIKSLLGIETDLPPIKFLDTIIKDYNFYAGK